MLATESAIPITFPVLDGEALSPTYAKIVGARLQMKNSRNYWEKYESAY
ncbi:MAG: hypothetical protein ACUVTL_10205 [Thermoproteota archaeon]